MQTMQQDRMIEAVRPQSSKIELQMLSTMPHQIVPISQGDMTCRCCTSIKMMAVHHDAKHPLSNGTSQPGHGTAPLYLDGCPARIGRERKRDKTKRFVVEKGPRIAGAAAAIAIFVFNIVSNCC